MTTLSFCIYKDFSNLDSSDMKEKFKLLKKYCYAFKKNSYNNDEATQ